MKTALLLIHGFLTCTDDWDLFVPELESMFDEVVLFKQPGHERADGKPHYKDFTADSAFAELDKKIGEMEKEFDVIDIMGHSMGGGMAVYAAATMKKVRRAVLLAPAIKFPRPGAFARSTSAVSRLETMAGSCADEDLADVLSASAENVKSTFKESLDVFFKRLLPHWSPHNIMTFMRIMGRCEKYASQITCPLAVAWGELDEFIPRRSAELILEQAKSKDKIFICYETIGHAMMYLGNIKVLLRDVKCILDDGDPCDAQVGTGELRTVCRLTEQIDGRLKIITVTDKLVNEKGVVKEIKERSERFERCAPAEKVAELAAGEQPVVQPVCESGTGERSDENTL